MDLQSTTQQAIETANSIAAKAIVSGASAALYGGFTATDIAAFGGLFIAFVGLMAKLFFDWQLLKIARVQVSDDKIRELAAKGKLDLDPRIESLPFQP